MRNFLISERENFGVHNYHSKRPWYDTNDCWTLKNKIQDLIEAKEIEFDPPEIPNVIKAPIPKHGQGVNVVDDECFVSSVNDLTTPLLTIKQNLLRAGLFPGCDESCHLCMSLPKMFVTEDGRPSPDD